MKLGKKLVVMLLALTMVLSLAACGGQSTDSQKPAQDTKESAQDTKEPAKDAAAEKKDAKEPEKEPAKEAAAEKEIVLRRAYAAPHGTKSFGRFAVVMEGDKFLAAHIEEFQFGDVEGSKFTFVPNSDQTAEGAFATGYAEGKALFSKNVNADLYSENMKEKAQATVTLADNYKAIQDFVVGKTVAEVEKVVAENPTGKPVDAVTGATLVDTSGYLAGLVEAAKNDKMESKVKTSEDLSQLKLAFIQGAPHGDKSFSDTVVAVVGDKVVAANVDEFQFMKDVEGVPNSDKMGEKEFATNYAEGVVLASKKVNSETYSKNMAEIAKSTVSIADNFKAIEAFAAGKTVAEIEKVVSDNPVGKPVDAVTGATLVGTSGYLKEIAEAAKLAK